MRALAFLTAVAADADPPSHGRADRRRGGLHGIAHLKNWRALARHHGRREHMSDLAQAVAGLLSHQQTAALSRGAQA
ncbi:hypothetical protein [Streptomyces sp. cf386]|uniref:hypothetical protein n=1 Tax=Streptomyces sp. cf386 TaxID=1761904 RepID=UPI00210EAE6F|nr:hypothetical protein [Streptomyces sp. cf386]